MNKLPKILIIDDIYGKRGRERDNFCIRLGMKDLENISSEVENPVAEAVIFSGQVEENEKIDNDLKGTLKIIRNGWKHAPRWALILLDLHFDTGKPEDRLPKNYFGLKILKELRRYEEFDDLPIIILSAMARDDIEQEFADHGALHFIDKTEMDRNILKDVLFEFGLLEDEKNIGHSVPFLKCLREARNRSLTGNENILILGETGTGKELLAEYIHEQSGRKGDFNPLFTQGVPETLIEDRLFGHMKGSFDGAYADQPGAAELADKGTLFIDEFGNIPFKTQEKLLRLLDKRQRETQRIGSMEQTIEKAIYKYKGLKVLSATHLSINLNTNIEEIRSTNRQKTRFSSYKPDNTNIANKENINFLIDNLKNFNFNRSEIDPDKLKSKLLEIQDAYAVFIVKYLKIALEENKRRYDGKIEITPAMKWASGDITLSTTESERMLKKFLKINSESVRDFLESDPVLRKVATDLDLIKDI